VQAFAPILPSASSVTINGVGGIYDRHQYREEKAQALAALAKLIESIVHPTDKVVPMHRRK